jgi:hypothetical protein
MKVKIITLLLLTSCSMSEILEQPLPRTKSDTTTYQPRPIDTTQTSGVPITFDVSVEGWEDIEIDINL